MRRRLLGWISVLAFALSAGAVRAATPLSQVRVSPDVTVLLGPTVDDENVAADNLAGTVALQGIGTIPAGADVDAYAVRPNGNQLLSFDTTVTLLGGVVAGPADVVRFDGASYAIEQSASAMGVPDGVNLDALAVKGTALLLSFDVAFDAGGLHIEPADLVLSNGGVLGAYFGASAAGIPAGLDLDGADYLDCNGHLLLSFDGSGTIGGVSFDDEDVIEFDGASTWEMSYDGSAQHAGWTGADLDSIQATPNLGPGPPVVFGQTVVADANKTTFRWPISVPFRLVGGEFTSSTSIGTYAATVNATAVGASFNSATPPAGSGLWFLVKPWQCTQTSWQSTLGAEPGRDTAIP